MKQNTSWGLNTKDIDTSIHPGDDFFGYVNNTWIKKTTIPSDQSHWGSFDILREQSQKQLRSILEGLKQKKERSLTTEERKLRDLYVSATDKKQRDKEEYEKLEPFITRIQKTEEEELASLFAELNTIGVDPFFNVWFDQDDKNSDRQVMRFSQGGLSMPDREYYLRTDQKSKKIQKEFLRYIEKIFILVGYNKKQASAHAKTIFDLEKTLAAKSLPRVETRDPIKNYNKKKVSKLEKEYSGFAWKEYVSMLRKEPVRELIVDQPKYMKEVSRIIKKHTIEDVRIYVLWHLLDGYAGALSSNFHAAAFAFHGKVMSGAQKQKPLWKQAISVIDTFMGDAIGKLYVKEYYPKESRRQMQIMVEDVKKAFRSRIENLVWMDKKTKAKALKKLDTLVTKIGYPKKWHSYASVDITADSFAQNIINLEKHHFNYEIKRVGGPSDRDEWDMSPATVNAYYSPNFNEIVFPAAILQPPFFNPHRDVGVNYGAIGAVIGHEISHAFDDSGSQFDEKGNLKNWWTETTRKQFEKRTKKLIRQYDQFEPIPGERVNGKLTLGENIADVCGVLVAYDAYQKYLGRNKKENVKKKGFTPEQRLFLGHALVERSTERSEFLTMQVRMDPHSPAKYRVNGVVANIPAFFSAFDVTPEHKLHLPKNKQADIW